ncbi:MAG: hypothetical protein CVU39_26585 [Chloroflexi bacterium HGW-Chloroflexi-10]|nr:MAG: hypothetical protein CVU39_26585 [Chloroflexi bacterium HGW-Chloroflexi-10]
MTMKLQKILFSPTVNRMGLWLGEHLSPQWGYRLGSWVANAISRRKNAEQVRAVRANQWVLSGYQAGAVELDVMVKAVYLSSSRSLYDYYHCMRDPEEIRKKIIFDTSFDNFMKRSKTAMEGSLGLILHMGAFDLAGYAITLSGMRPQILSYPNPNTGYQWHNELRRQAGLNVTPLSMKALHQANLFLKSGGTVITGLDRPWPGAHQYPYFLGAPTHIPVTPIQMALRTRVPVAVIACIRQPGSDHYILFASDLIEMRPNANRDVELVENTERVLAVAEPFLRMAPEQWAMFYPVWPQILSEMP